MTEREQLLAAILDDPDEDTARLVYADWLEEHSEAERAEFIRVQVELANWGGCDWKTKHVRAGYVDCDQWNDLLGEGRRMTWCPTCARRTHLRARARELVWDFARPHCKWFPEFSNEWTFKLISFAGECRNPSARVSRGFVSAITCSCADFLRHAAAIWREQPVMGVSISDREPYPSGWRPQVVVWREGVVDNERHTLPKPIFDTVAYDHELTETPAQAKYWPTLAAASTAISDAYVAYGRARAARGTVGVGT